MADIPENENAQGPLDVLLANTLTSKANSGSTTKPLISNQSALDNMQKIYEQKLAEKNYFMQDMADAAAWWSGGAAGPSNALALRAQTRANQAATLQDLQAQIMQGQVNLSQLEGLGNDLRGPGSPAVAGANVQPGAGNQDRPNASQYTYKGTEIPEDIFNTMNSMRQMGYGTKAVEEYAKYAQSKAKAQAEANVSWNRADIMENVPILAPDGQVYPITTTKEEYLEYKRNPLHLPTALGGWINPKYPGPKSGEKKANGGAVRMATGGAVRMAMGGDPMEAQLTQNVPPAPEELVGNVPPSTERPNLQGGMLDRALSSIMGSAEAAPPQGSVSVSGWKPPVVNAVPNYGMQKQEAQSGLQQGEAKNSAELKALEEERSAAGKFIADLQNQSFSPTTLQKAQEIIDMAKSNPEYFGYGFKNDPIGFLMGLTGTVEDSAHGPSDEAAKNTSRLTAAKQFFQGEDAMEKRSRMNQLAKELGIAYEKEQFGGTGSKMGAQLTTISQAAKGLGANFPASQNLAQALTVQIVHERNSELAKEWQKYKSTPGLKNPDPYAFMNSPKVQGIVNEWNLKLNDTVGKVMNKPKEGSEDKDVNGNPIVFKDGKWMRVKK